MKQQTLNIDSNLDKEQFRQVMQDQILSGEATIKKEACHVLNCLILRSAADLVGFTKDYSKFSLLAASAWENDETHVRHLSCEHEFCVPRQVSAKWESDKRGKYRYTKGDPWKPGKTLRNLLDERASSEGTLGYWQTMEVDRVLEYIISSVLDYYFGKPTRGSSQIADKNDYRHHITREAGMLYNLESWIYHMAEAKNDLGLGTEGAVVRIQLDKSGEDYSLEYLGNAYVTDPQFVVEAAGYENITENVYL
tara:strand:- start:654 stop:1406 length:753 start_codon:yes stop_codon:yes gene_type:complete